MIRGRTRRGSFVHVYSNVTSYGQCSPGKHWPCPMGCPCTVTQTCRSGSATLTEGHEACGKEPRGRGDPPRFGRTILILRSTELHTFYQWRILTVDVRPFTRGPWAPEILVRKHASERSRARTAGRSGTDKLLRSRRLVGPLACGHGGCSRGT